MAKNSYSDIPQNLENLELSSITLDEEIQPRSKITHRVVQEYKRAMSAGDVFPPVIVFYNGLEHWLADGFHRFDARVMMGESEILADVWQGNRHDALLYGVEANIGNDFELSEVDITRNVIKLIGHPNLQKWTDEEIATHCGTDPFQVNRLREQRLTDLFKSLVELKHTTQLDNDGVPLEAKNFNLDAALKMDATTFGPLISDLFLDIWADMMIDNFIREQREASIQPQDW